jgi:GNAT superfamily N-acetyltransferase
MRNEKPAMTTSTRPPLQFRWAVPADADAIAQLAHSAYRGDASRAGWTTEADFLDGQRIDHDGVLELLTDGQGIVLAESGDGALLACCHVSSDGDDAWFGLFAVDPLLQGAGIGDQLLAEAERRVGERFGSRRLRMKVIWLRDSLIAWYQRRGYQRIDETHPFPYGQERFGRPRRDDLYFIVLEKQLAFA